MHTLHCSGVVGMESESTRSAVKLLHDLWNEKCDNLHSLTVRAQIIGGTAIRRAFHGTKYPTAASTNQKPDMDVLNAAHATGNVGKRFWRYCLSAAEQALNVKWKASRAHGYSLTKEDPHSPYDMDVVATRIQEAREELLAAGCHWGAIDMSNLSNVVTIRSRELLIEYRRLISDVNIIQDKLDKLNIKYQPPKPDMTAVLEFEYYNELLPEYEQLAWSSRSHFKTRFVNFTLNNFQVWIFALRDSLHSRKTHQYVQKPSDQSFAPLSVVENTLLTILETALSGLSKASDDQEEVFRKVVCDFGGKKNRSIRKQLKDGRLHIGSTFKTNGCEIQVEFYDTLKAKQSKNEVETHADETPTALDDVEVPSEYKKTWIIGGDFGNTFPGAFTAIRPDNQKMAFCFRRECFEELTVLRSQRHIETEKLKHADIYEKEQIMEGSRGKSLQLYTEFAKNWSSKEKDLFNFYSSMSMKNFRNQGRRRRRRFFDMVFKCMLSMMDLKPHQKTFDEADRYVFAFGLGKFKTVHGLPSIHSELAAHLVRKASSM